MLSFFLLLKVFLQTSQDFEVTEGAVLNVVIDLLHSTLGLLGGLVGGLFLCALDFLLFLYLRQGENDLLAFLVELKDLELEGVVNLGVGAVFSSPSWATTSSASKDRKASCCKTSAARVPSKNT